MFSCVWLFVTLWTVAHQVPLSMYFPGKNTRMDWHFFFVSISLLFWLFCLLDSLYKWGHVVFVFVLHLSLCIKLSRSIRDIENGMISFLYWLSNILLKIYIYIYIYTHTHSYIYTHTHTPPTSYLWTLRLRRPTPVFFPGESQGWGSLMGCHLWGHTESDTTEAT